MGGEQKKEQCTFYSVFIYEWREHFNDGRNKCDQNKNQVKEQEYFRNKRDIKEHVAYSWTSAYFSPPLCILQQPPPPTPPLSPSLSLALPPSLQFMAIMLLAWIHNTEYHWSPCWAIVISIAKLSVCLKWTYIMALVNLLNMTQWHRKFSFCFQTKLYQEEEHTPSSTDKRTHTVEESILEQISKI